MANFSRTPAHSTTGKKRRGKITRDSLNRLLSAIDLTTHIGQTVELKRSGSRHSGLCPFHQENTPSFFVFEENYKCFGCGVYGNAIDFEMEKTGAPFPEVVQGLAERYNVELSYENGEAAEPDEGLAHRRRLSKVLKEVSAFYSRCLKHERLGERARRYLIEERGFLAETLDSHELGYALSQDSLLAFAKKHEIAPALFQELSLVKESSRWPGRTYDFFRDRLMVPIHDERGDVIAFGARALPEREGSHEAASQRKAPKYLNSSESVLFEKSRVLFNLHRARAALRRTNEAVVVEGYLDAIALNQAGVDNVVAVLGTALTPEHVKVLSRYVDRVVLCFDADAAGQQALKRSFQMAWPLNLVQLAAFSVEGAKDPDELLRKQGVESFLRQKQQAMPLVRAVAQRVIQGCAYREERVRRIVGEVMPVVQKNPGRAETQTALEDLVELLKLPSVEQLIQRAQPSRRSKERETQQASLPPEKAKSGLSSLAFSEEDWKVSGPLELRFLLSLMHTPVPSWPRRLQATCREDGLSGAVAGEYGQRDISICSKALKQMLSAAGRDVVDALASAQWGAEAAVLGSGRGLGRSPLREALQAFAEKDVVALESLGLPGNILRANSAPSARFMAEKGVFHIDNLSFLRFWLKDALEARKCEASTGQTIKLLIDLEIAFLDNELARWTAVEKAPHVDTTTISGHGNERTRRIMDERVRRFRCLQQENGDQNQSEDLLE